MHVSRLLAQSLKTLRTELSDIAARTVTPDTEE
jgi:hypothetical protein